MPTPRPIAPHGALGDPPPDRDAATGQTAAAPQDEDYESDTEFTEDEAPASVSGSGSDDHS
jgi:hypothetical protein